MALAPLCLQCLSRGYAGARTAPCPAHIPLDVIASVGKRVPIVVALRISRDRKHFPSAVRFDAFDDVDPGHNFSPAIRISRTAGKTANGWKLQKTKRVGRSWHSTTELLPPSGGTTYALIHQDSRAPESSLPHPHFPAAFLQARGLTPNSARNIRLKFETSPKPQSSAMFTIFARSLLSLAAAR